MLLLKALIGRAAVLGISTFLGRGAFLVAFALLARGLSTTDLARVSFFILTLAMLASYGALGVGVAATRYFSLAEDRDAEIRPRAHALIALSFGAAVLVTLAVPVLWPLATSQPLDGWFLLALLFVILDVTPYSALMGMQRYGRLLVVSVFAAFVLLLGTAWAAYQASLDLAFAAIACSYAVRFTGDSLFAFRALGTRFWRGFGITRSHLREVLRLIVPMAVTSLLAASGPWLVGELVRTRWNALEYSFYALGLQWYAIGIFLPAMLMTALFPMQVRAAQRESDGQQSRKLLIHGIALGLGASILVAAISVPLAPFILGFYGDAFAGEGWIVWGFLAAAGLAAPSTAVGNQLVASNRQHLWTVFSAGWLCVLLAVGFVLLDWTHRAAPVAFGLANLVLFAFGAAALKMTATSVPSPVSPDKEKNRCMAGSTELG